MSEDGSESWGHDVFDVVAVRAMGARMVEAERRVEAGYAAMIREAFEVNEAVRTLLEPAGPVVDRQAELEPVLAPLVRPGTEDLFSSALGAALRELDGMRALPSAMYVVDRSTGTAVAPFRTDTVFRTPDYVDEGGTVRPGRLTVHPAVTTEIAQRRVLESREQKLSALAPAAPMAYEHELDPASILRHAEAALHAHGIEPGPVPDRTAGKPTVGYSLVIGKEYYDGVAQSANSNFHRSQMFGKILARKVAEHMDAAGTSPRRCELVSISAKEGAKLRWYEVVVRAPA